jgi:hypothetical protein
MGKAGRNRSLKDDKKKEHKKEKNEGFSSPNPNVEADLVGIDWSKLEDVTDRKFVLTIKRKVDDKLLSCMYEEAITILEAEKLIMPVIPKWCGFVEEYFCLVRHAQKKKKSKCKSCIIYYYLYLPNSRDLFLAN